MSHRKNPDFRRSGFTLIEMLVAIGILVVLATLAVAVVPKVQERAKASRGGDQLHGWYLEAKQMSVRDRALRGVRLLIDPNTMLATSALYIQQPDTFTGGAIQFDNPTIAGANPFKASFLGVDITGGLSSGLAANDPLWPIQPGDFLQVQGGVSHRITTVVGPTATTPAYILTSPTAQYPYASQLWDAVNLPPAPAPNYVTFDYIVIRQPRPIIGEPVLYFPNNVAVDFTTNTPTSMHSIPDWTAATITPSGLSFDILFTPSGTLTGSIGESFNKVILWVRDYTQDLDQPGEQPLIVIFSRTGRTGGFPVNTNQGLYPPGNPALFPYYYVLDPRATGF
jgi:prepilin-type N-terminal cleavage/methylation domain-containing protein